jgi:hypothetical protein
MSIPIAVSLIITFGIVVIVGMESLKSFFLDRERIKADALVRIEEVKAKNQFELEKLIHRDNVNEIEFSTDGRKVREKI